MWKMKGIGKERVPSVMESVFVFIWRMYFVYKGTDYESSPVETQWGICLGRGVEANNCSPQGHFDGHPIDTTINSRS
jgi:hypothetical protein